MNPRRRRAPGLAGVRKLEILPGKSLVMLLIAHLPMALAMKSAPRLAAVHALSVLLYGLFLAVNHGSLPKIACWGAYTIGSEILWRACKAPIPWEFGKYAVVLVFAVTLMMRSNETLPALPIVYVALLLPACFVPLAEFVPNVARKAISQNISGPICLAISVCFFSRVRCSGIDRAKILAWMVVPLAGMAFVAMFRIVTMEDLEFGTQSDPALSGGFGPNQVSAILSWGSFAALLLSLDQHLKVWVRWLFLGVCVWLIAQSALTFSRTGVYLFAICLLSTIPFLLAVKHLRSRAIVVLVILGLGVCVSATMLESFTNGQLSARYGNSGLSNRDNVAMSDVKMWLAHPVFGVGAGMAEHVRVKEFGFAILIAPHTEYSRLIAEHGMLGVIAMVLLLAMGWNSFFGAGGPAARILVVPALVWVAFFCSVSGMRLAVAPFLFGLAAIRVRPRAQQLRGRQSPNVPATPLHARRRGVIQLPGHRNSFQT